MLVFDKAKRTYSMSLNWMGRHVTIPVFMIGPREAWAP